MVLNIKDQYIGWKLLDAVQKVHILQIIMQLYKFAQQGKTLNVTFCQWNELGPSASFTTGPGSILGSPIEPLHVPCTALMAGKCLSLRLYKETVKESAQLQPHSRIAHSTAGGAG